jgi:uncharacterized protein (DUF2147 family)
MSTPSKRLRLVCLTIAIGASASGVARADSAAAPKDEAASPAGFWKTFGDEGNAPKSIVHITVENGKASGTIEKIFPAPNEDPSPVCDKCSGELKGKPVLGMRFLWALVLSGSKWTDGAILDPDNGKTYSCTVEVIDGGKRLKVRGYVGIPLLGRSQIWERTEAPSAPGAAK